MDDTKESRTGYITSGNVTAHMWVNTRGGHDSVLSKQTDVGADGLIYP